MLLVPAGNPSEWTGQTGNNTYVLAGAVPTLVDAGVGLPAHLDAVASALGGTALALVLITHGHRDHTAGIPALLERWPKAAVRQFGADGREDNEAIRAGDTELVALHTPGHAPDHYCFLDRATRDVYCGDLVRRDGTIVIPGSRGGRLKQYLASLQRVLSLDPRRLLPGHGPIVESPRALIEYYLRHRAEREREILEALRNGCRSPIEIVRRVYPAIPQGLSGAAADSVLAHLEKLADDGRAQERNGLWFES